MCNLKDHLLIATQHLLCKMSRAIDTQMPILMIFFKISYHKRLRILTISDILVKLHHKWTSRKLLMMKLCH